MSTRKGLSIGVVACVALLAHSLLWPLDGRAAVVWSTIDYALPVNVLVPCAYPHPLGSSPESAAYGDETRGVSLKG